MPLPPEKSVDAMLAEASHSLRHLTLEGQPARLSVGDDAEPRFVLKGDGLVHSPILDRLEFLLTHRARADLLPRLQESGRTEQAAHDIGMSGDHHTWPFRHSINGGAVLERSCALAPSGPSRLRRVLPRARKAAGKWVE